MSERGSAGFGGFLLGVAVGAVVGFLFAPEAGEETRRKLSRRLRDVRDLAEENAEEVRGLLEAEEEAAADAPRSTREELQRRLQATRRRRRPAAEGKGEEGDEPVA